MKVAVLSGSPKGEDSVSLQSLYYMGKKFPEHTYEVFHISKSINKIKSDNERFNTIIDAVREADLVMWVTPVYTFLIPAQLKRFIELIHERKAADAFQGKFAGVLTTSINFFDHCAVNYLRSTCEDLGMLFGGAFAADSFDLLDEGERNKLQQFAQLLFDNASVKAPLQKAFFPLNTLKRNYSPGEITPSVDLKGKKILVIKDQDYSNTSLGSMIKTFTSSFNGTVDVVNLMDVDVKGGCLGCIQCGFDHECIYDGKDGFKAFFNTTAKEADILVFAGETRDRWLSSTWKQFFDRSFFNNHIPVLADKQVAWLISGPLGQLANLREIAEAFVEWQRANLVDIVTDEEVSDADLDASIQRLADGLVNASLSGYIKPATFLGKGGHKIFRDDIWGRHRFVFQVDHAYYEANGFYDFPQYDEAAIEMNKNMMALTKDPEMRKAVRGMIKSEMVKNHKKIVESA